jgi:pimeloyl-ACP methyl ester carboxylesterase
MRPAVEALAVRCRVITFSLADEPSCGGRFDETEGLSCYVQQIGEALDAAGVRRAAICGVSFGGLIAAAFAAAHPERVTALVLVSALPPGWQPDARVRFYLRAPVLLSPLFCLASLRLYREIRSASQGVASGARAALRHGLNVVTHMLSPSRMARRARLLPATGIGRTLAAVHVPTLVVTGSDGLDRVVPVRLTLEYLGIWPHARHEVIPRTGHLGLITRPDAFAAVVAPFVERASAEADAARSRHAVEVPGSSPVHGASGRRVG